jgi:flagellar hook-basal body complex protein FliE
MTGIEGVAAIGGADAAPLAMRIGEAAAAPAQLQGATFSDVLMTGLRNVDAKIANAEGLVRQFAVDDSIPVHRVTMALGEARLAVEMAMQVRDRLVESYRELMNMPL